MIKTDSAGWQLGNGNRKLEIFREEVLGFWKHLTVTLTDSRLRKASYFPDFTSGLPLI